MIGRDISEVAAGVMAVAANLVPVATNFALVASDFLPVAAELVAVASGVVMRACSKRRTRHDRRGHRRKQDELSHNLLLIARHKASGRRVFHCPHCKKASIAGMNGVRTG